MTACSPMAVNMLRIKMSKKKKGTMILYHPWREEVQGYCI